MALSENLKINYHCLNFSMYEPRCGVEIFLLCLFPPREFQQPPMGTCHHPHWPPLHPGNYRSWQFSSRRRRRTQFGSVVVRFNGGENEPR